MTVTFRELPDTYLDSRGFIIQFDTDFDFNGVEKVVFILEKPDGSNEVRAVDAADYGQGPNSDLVYGRVLTDDIDQIGDYFAQVAVRASAGATLLYSEQLKFRCLPASATSTEVATA